MKIQKHSRIILSIIITLTTLLAVGNNVVLGNPDPPRLLNYQGKLTDANGPVAGTVSITFSIYDAGGSPIWTETHGNVTVTNGLFNAILGGTTPIPDTFFNSGEIYLGLNVNGEEIMPRQQVVSVLFALKAQDAETLQGRPASDFGDGYSLDAADGSPTDAVFVDNNGNVGIGTVTPATNLEVYGGQSSPVLQTITNAFHGAGAGAGISLRTYYGEGGPGIAERWQILARASGGNFNNPLVFRNIAGTQVMMIRQNGNVGIGTTNPAYMLDVAGAISAQTLRVENTSSGQGTTRNY